MSWVTEDCVQDEEDDDELDSEVEDFDSEVFESELLELSEELSSSPFSSLSRLVVKLVKSSTSARTPLTALTPCSISPVIFDKLLVIQATLWIMSLAILSGSGIKPLATRIRSRFVEPLQGLDPLSPPREFNRFSASGSIPLIALIASSPLSLAGLFVQMLIIGIIPTLSLLDKTLALELAIIPVATKLVGGAVVATGTGVVYAPPIMTGTSWVVPETTLVNVDITGCWLIEAALEVLVELEEVAPELVEIGSVDELDGLGPFEFELVDADWELPVDEELDSEDVPVDVRLPLWDPNRR
jgi:hypothetical protein